jgi:DNA-binding GntR family transcriptional regulator
MQRKTVADHRRMLRYIAEGNGDGAARTMRKHLVVTHGSVLPQYGGCAVEMITPSPLAQR